MSLSVGIQFSLFEIETLKQTTNDITEVVITE